MTTITREHLEDEVLKSIQKKAESIMPKDAKVILFGSRARRDAKADSDWDILVLLNKDKIDEQDHDNYTYPLWELGWQINQMIHPIVYSMKDWQSKKGSPFLFSMVTRALLLNAAPRIRLKSAAKIQAFMLRPGFIFHSKISRRPHMDKNRSAIPPSTEISRYPLNQRNSRMSIPLPP